MKEKYMNVESGHVERRWEGVRWEGGKREGVGIIRMHYISIHIYVGICEIFKWQI